MTIREDAGTIMAVLILATFVIVLAEAVITDTHLASDTSQILILMTGASMGYLFKESRRR